jgi:hypothetical protein
MTRPFDQAAQAGQTGEALFRLLDRIALWLIEVRTWAFAGLIALNLVVISALITVGPVDSAVLVAVAAFGCALPLEVAGMFLLRLSKDLDDVGLEALTLRSFEEAHFPSIHAYCPPRRDRDSIRQRRTRVTMGYVLAIAALTLGLTLTGMVAALWHMAPWVAEVSASAVLLSLLLMLAVVRHSMPAESDAERRLKASFQRTFAREPRATGESEDTKMAEPTVTVTRRAFSLACRVDVNVHAAAAHIWSLLTDAASFPRWNSTVAGIEGEIRNGARLRVHVPGTDRVFTPTVSELVPNKHMTWTGGFGPIFRGVRTFELHATGDGSTDFTMVERFSGLIMPIVKRSFPDFGPIFGRYASDLKRAAEQ